MCQNAAGVVAWLRGVVTLDGASKDTIRETGMDGIIGLTHKATCVVGTDGKCGSDNTVGYFIPISIAAIVLSTNETYKTSCILAI